MSLGSDTTPPPASTRWDRLACPSRPPEPLTTAELRNGLWSGNSAPNDVEALLVMTARAEGALEDRKSVV